MSRFLMPSPEMANLLMTVNLSAYLVYRVVKIYRQAVP